MNRSDRVNRAIALGLPLPPFDDEDPDDDGRELSLRERLFRFKRPDEKANPNLIERYLRAGIRSVPRTLGGVAQLGGTALEATGRAISDERDLLTRAGGGLRRGGEWLSERVAAERERQGLPETTAEKAADIGGTLTGEAVQLFLPGGAGVKLGARVGGPVAKGLGGVLGGAAGTVPIGAGLEPEESTLGLISPEMAENVVARAAVEGVAAVVTGGVLYVGGRAIGRVAAPAVRRALGRPAARPGAATPEPHLPSREATPPQAPIVGAPTTYRTLDYEDVAGLPMRDIAESAEFEIRRVTNIEEDLFGEEGAKRYKRLQRIANSSRRSHEEVQRASEQLSEIEDALSPEQAARLFGRGEQGLGLEAWNEIQRAAKDFAPGTLSDFTDQDLQKVIGRELVTGEPHKNVASALRLRESWQELARRGADERSIIEAVAIHSKRANTSVEDARELVSSAIEGLRKRGVVLGVEETAPARGLRQLPSGQVPPLEPERAAPTAAPTAAATGARAQPLTPQQLEREVVGTVAEAAEPRVPRTWEETQALASDLGVDAPEQLARARDLGGVELARIHRNATEIGDEIANVTRQIDEGALDPVSGQRRIDQLENEYSALITQFSAEGTEAGRALNFLKSFARNVKDPAYWLVKARRVKGKDLTPEETTKIRDLVARVQEGDSAAADELATAVQDLTQIHWFDKVMTVVRSSALSDITMRLRDALGDNPTMALLEAVKDLPSGIADLFLSGIERVSGRSLGGRVEGFGGVRPGGILQQARGLGEGVTELGRELFSPKRIGRLPQRGQYVETGIATAGRPVGIHPSADWLIALPFKLAAASDILGRPVAAGRVAFNEARAQAIREGVKGRAARNARIREIMANPSEEIAREISEQADLAVYMADNEATRKWSNIIASGKGRYIQPIAPFTKSVTNVVERAFDYSPASWLRVAKRANDLLQVARSTPGISTAEQEVLRKARRRLTQQTGRATIGGAPFLAGWVLADRITPWYPRYGEGAAEERRRRAQAGIPHGAIRIGDRWIPLDRNFGPFGVGMLMAAQLRELTRGDDPDIEDDWTAEDHETALGDGLREHGRDLLELVSLKGAGQLGLALGQGMYELTPISDIEEFIRTLGYGPGEPEAAVRQAERVGGLPTPGVFRLGTRLTDPYRRETSNLLEQYQAQIPKIPGVSEALGLPHSQQLPPRLDPYGEPIPSPRAGLEALNPFATQRSRLPDDEFRTELDRIGYAIPSLGSRTGETDEELRERNEFLGPYTRQLTEAVLASDDYQSLDGDALVAELGLSGKPADLLRADAADEQKALVSGAITSFRGQVTRIMNEDEYEALDPERLVLETGVSGEQADRLRAEATAARQQYLLERLGITAPNQ